MKVVVPTNNKGGVGKTKNTILLAEYTSLILGLRTAVIDLDPQCNVSRRFLKMENDPATPGGVIPPLHPDYDHNNFSYEEEGRSSIADIFFAKEVFPYPTAIPNLDIMPGYADKLHQAEAVRRNEVIEKVHNHLNTFLSLPEVKAAYDIIIIDTAPSKGPLTIAAVKAATHLLIPCVMEEQPIQGIYGMLQLWMQESLRREPNNPLKLIGILPNMFRQINLHRDMLESLKQNESIAPYIMPVKLWQRAAFAEVDTEGADPRTIFDFPDSNQAKKEAIEVCKYITERIFADE